MNEEVVVHIYIGIEASLVAQIVKYLPEMQETQVRPPGWEDPLDKGMVTYYTNLVFVPGEFHRQRNLVGYSPWSCKELDTTE